jgi:hypothetical protein
VQPPRANGGSSRALAIHIRSKHYRKQPSRQRPTSTRRPWPAPQANCRALGSGHRVQVSPECGFAEVVI